MLQSARGRAQAPTPHTPMLQAAAPPEGAGHIRPHAPQWSTLVLRLTSHPFNGLPSQSAKPGLHRTKRHAPSVQSLVALARLHARPQAPQWSALVRVFTSQPSATMPLQSANPAKHARMPQTPIAQPGVLFASTPHTLEHPPQLLTSLRVSASQPLASLLSQFSKPGAHSPILQTPIMHVAEPLAIAHTLPQRPQCAVELRRSASQPSAGSALQSAKPSLQRKPQTPIAHVAVALALVGHGLPQRPQCSALALVLVSHPFETSPSQSPKLPEQRPTAQRPIEQVGSALGTAHAIPQAPQLAGLLWVSTHASVQQVCPIGQGCVGEHPITQRLPRHTCPEGQCVSVTQATQVCVLLLQRGVSPEHPSSREQPGTH